MLIARKTAKLFTRLGGSSQLGQPIVTWFMQQNCLVYGALKDRVYKKAKQI